MEKLTAAPQKDLENLIQHVLEKRPELRTKFARKKTSDRGPTAAAIENSVRWDPVLTGRLCRIYVTFWNLRNLE